jgi:hypothetical protein
MGYSVRKMVRLVKNNMKILKVGISESWSLQLFSFHALVHGLANYGQWLDSCYRDHVAHNTENIYYLALNQKVGQP